MTQFISSGMLIQSPILIFKAGAAAGPSGTLFSALWIDLLLAAAFGAIGGAGLDLLQERGLQLPRRYNDGGVTFFDLGFIAAILTGVVAALITYAINTPKSKEALLGSCLIAGIGGTGILKGYVSGTAARSEADFADQYHALATHAVAQSADQGMKDQLQSIAKTHYERRARMGIG